MTTLSGGITLLGSEMLTWSDADGEVGAFGGLLAPHLLHNFGGSRGRVLVVGPTSAPVISDVAGQFEAADVLVRSWPDAQQLRSELPDTVGIFCGPLDRMTQAGSGYDAVVAVAGMDRLHSAEEQTPTWHEVVDGLAGLLSDTGELYLAVGNTVGVDRLLSVSPGSRHHDADWPDGHVVPASAGTADEVIAYLGAVAGLAGVDTWFCHGRRSDPLVATTAATLTAARADAVLIRELARAYDVADAAAPPLKDPAGTVRDLVRCGLGAATAPLGVLHLRRGVEAAPAVASEPDLAVLVQEPVHDGAPAVAYRLTRQGDGWARTLLSEPASFAVTDALTRDTAALAGPVPLGETVADALAACCAAHDASAAGVLVRQYRDWLAPDAGSVPPEKVPLLPRLVVAGDELAALDPSWTADAPAPRDVVLLRGLLDVAADLLSRGIRHPWSPAASARVIAGSMAAAAGIEDVEPLLVEAVALDAGLRPAGTAPDYDAPAGTGRLSYAELAEVAHGLAERAAEGDEHVLWLLRRLQGRQRALRRTRRQLQSLSNSREVRVGRKIFWIRDKLRRRALAKAAASNGPAGEWRDPAARAADNDPEQPIEVESTLLPPGYRPGPRVAVIPPEED